MTEHITVSRELLRQVRDLLTFMQEWIDAVPADAQLPSMPGFDGDWAAGVQADLRAALEQPAAEPVQTARSNQAIKQLRGALVRIQDHCVIGSKVSAICKAALKDTEHLK